MSLKGAQLSGECSSLGRADEALTKKIVIKMVRRRKIKRDTRNLDIDLHSSQELSPDGS